MAAFITALSWPGASGEAANQFSFRSSDSLTSRKLTGAMPGVTDTPGHELKPSMSLSRRPASVQRFENGIQSQIQRTAFGATTGERKSDPGDDGPTAKAAGPHMDSGRRHRVGDQKGGGNDEALARVMASQRKIARSRRYAPSRPVPPKRPRKGPAHSRGATIRDSSSSWMRDTARCRTSSKRLSPSSADRLRMRRIA